MRTIGLVLLLSTTTFLAAQTAPSTATTAADAQIDAPVLVASRTTDILPGEFSTSTRPILNVVRPVNQREIQEQKAAKVRREFWYALAVSSHGSAFLDAWSTRDVIGRGGREMNPLVKPFAGSAALYPVMQVGPTAMDYLGRRMMRSNSRFLRDTFWVPQFASTAISLSCGVHNLSVR